MGIWLWMSEDFRKHISKCTFNEMSSFDPDKYDENYALLEAFSVGYKKYIS